jgi:hypothetical protein
VAAGLAWPRTPAVYRHAWLPVLPVLAVYAGVAGARLLAWARAGGAPRCAAAAAVAVAVLAVPAGEAVWGAARGGAGAQLALAGSLLRHACPGEAVLDGMALAVFRPSAQRFGVLVTGVRYWIAQGQLAEEVLEADMRAARAPVGYADRRLRGLVGPVARFVERAYVPGPGGLLVAGGRVPVPGGPGGGRAYVDLLVAGAHRLDADPGIVVAIDGRGVAPGPVVLAAGRHEVTWTGGPGRIELAALPCAERRAAAGGPPGAGDPRAPR